MKRLYKILIAIILITMASVSIHPAADCDQAIIDKMMKMYDLESSEYRIEILSNPLKTAAVDSKNLSLRPLTQKEPLGLFSVMVRLYADGKVVETGQVRMKIKRFAEVLVVTDKFRRHELFAADRIAVKKMDVTNLVEQALFSIDETKGHRTKRNLKKGTILTKGAMESVPEVEPGMETLIVYNDGLFSITAPGIALQSGMAGDYIRVKNKATKKIIVARVVDNKVVAIDP